MKIFNTYEQAEGSTPYCIALGSFDGVHMGHQRLIEILKQNAECFGCSSMIYTFGVHPRKILKPEKPICMITNNVQRTEIFKDMNVDVLFLEDFAKIMNLSAEQFFKDVIVEKFNAKCLIIGYNFNFGKNGEGNAEKLAELGKQYGVKVEVVSPVLVDNEVVSSSLIRHSIKEGQVFDALHYLGRPYKIQGRVIHGKKNGKAMGIRTANIGIDKEAIVPLKGVYITDTTINGITYKSVTNVGVNPTFKGQDLSIETHVLGYEGDLYDQDIEVGFIKRLRGEISFETVEELIKQIKSDIQARLEFKML